MVNALKSFIDAEGKGNLPVPGVVPDMKANTDTYVQLQTLYRIAPKLRYREKANRDVSHFKAHLDKLIRKWNRPKISDDIIQRFCKNAAFISVIRTSSLAHEYAVPPPENLSNQYN